MRQVQVPFSPCGLAHFCSHIVRAIIVGLTEFYQEEPLYLPPGSTISPRVVCVCVWDSPVPYFKEALTAHHILFHLGRIERQRSDDM